MSQLNSVWVFSDNPERYAELFDGAQQWGQQVYAIVQNDADQAQAVMPYGRKMSLSSCAKRRAATH